MKVGFGVPERLRNKKTGAATELVYDFIKFWSNFDQFPFIKVHICHFAKFANYFPFSSSTCELL